MENNNQKWESLTPGILESLIGKKIEWIAPRGKANREYGDYHGIDIITAVDATKRNPLTCKSIEGDQLWFAFVDDLMDYKFMSYSDSFRVVQFKILE